MNTQTGEPDQQVTYIFLMLESLRERSSPLYATALDSIIKHLPPGCDEIRQLREHQKHYLAELEAKQ